MTRETKVGLVVAASFLCLVGVVVASRLGRNADTKQGEPVAQAIAPNHEQAPKQQSESAKSHDTPTNSKGPKNPPPDVVPAGLNTATTGKEGEPNKFAAWPSIPPAPLPASENTAAAPHVDPGAKSKVAEDASDKAHKDVVETLRQEKAKEDAAKAATGATLDKTVGALPKAVPVAELAALPTAPLVAGPVAPLGNGDGFFAPAAPQHADLAPAVDHKKGLDNPSPIPPPAPPKVDDAANGHMVAPPIVPLAGVGAAVSPPTPTANPTKASQEISSPPIVPPTDPKPKPAEPAPVPAINSPPSTQLAFNQQSPGPLKSTFDAGVKPVPPVAMPSVPAKTPTGPSPQVKKTDIDIYSCKADDTFETVSTRFYGTPKYARALLQYNRDGPMANKNTNLQDANPKLQPGQQVLVPPQDFLDARFASLIDNRPTVAPAAPAVSIKAPVSAGAVSQPPGTPPTTATNDATKSYRVPDPGQMLIEIAQQKLGDRGRWSEIYRLNPTLRPEYPIPAGTEIRLPGNANTP